MALPIIITKPGRKGLTDYLRNESMLRSAWREVNYGWPQQPRGMLSWGSPATLPDTNWVHT
jgi:hypothetical protein